ncbi:MAG: VOC family protein [Vicinamibacteria bacterium]|jgi:hypothetical protein
MIGDPIPGPGRFCWVDLAATDAVRAKAFYRDLLAWDARDTIANGGIFTRLVREGRDVGSLYQLDPRMGEAASSSHWTAYVRVDDVDATARRAVALGGQTLVRPFVVEGIARIALVLDAVGAVLGLWQPIDRHRADTRG